MNKFRMDAKQKQNFNMDSRTRCWFETVEQWTTNKRPPLWYSWRIKCNCQRILSEIMEVNKDYCWQRRLTLKRLQQEEAGRSWQKTAIVCSQKSFCSLCHRQVNYKLYLRTTTNLTYAMASSCLVIYGYIRTYKRMIPSYFEINGEFNIFVVGGIISLSVHARHFKFLFYYCQRVFKFK